MITSDSLDIHNDMLVTGSDRNLDCMQLTSLRYHKVVHTWDFNKKNPDAGFLHGTKFTNSGNYIITGGAGTNELRVYQNDASTEAKFKL